MGRRSFFFKDYVAHLVLIVCAFALAGVVFCYQMSSYALHAKQTELRTTVQSLAEQSKLLEGTDSDVIRQIYMLSIARVAKEDELTVLITDADGNIEMGAQTLVLIMLVTLVVMLVISFIISQHVTRPLKTIAAAAKEFAGGNFDVRVPEDNRCYEIDELAVSFNNMARDLDQLEELTRGFISNVSHEFKTPMTTIGGFVDGMIDGTIPLDQRDKYLKIIAEETKRLSRMVNRMLDAAKIQSGELILSPAPFDFTEMTAQILLSFEQKIEKKKLDVQCDLEERLTVMGYSDHLYRAVYNLTDNAVKFIEDGGTLRLKVHQEGRPAPFDFTEIGGSSRRLRNGSAMNGTIPYRVVSTDKRDKKIIAEETKRLSRMVNRMLDAAKIQSGELILSPAPFDFTEMTAQILLSFEQKIEKKKLDVQCDLEERLTVMGDRDHLYRAVYNLTDNAVKFIEDGGTLRLKVHQEGQLCVFAISNTGIGISAEDLPHVFDRFYKTDRSRSMDKTGAGLGLYIVKNIINLHGGEISVRSGGGETEFEFTLPLAPEQNRQNNA
ncbi:sensor histidine kinase [Agathobaculum butyriciproducens]|uniref:sensor histidine kinase n=1 Tax=Agathobaculum butyriciproducens TaxID=1628085 RepID=UPI0036D2FEB0